LAIYRAKVSPDIYRTCALLHSVCDLSLGRALLPGITASSASLATTCIFILISYHHALDQFTLPIVIGFTGIGIVYPTVNFEFLSRVGSGSEITLANLNKHQTGGLHNRKTLRSLRVFNSRVGEYFSVKRTSLPIYLLNVIDNVIALVLSV